MSEQNDIYIALQEFIVNFTSADSDHVLQGWPNRTPTPEDDDFIYMSILNQSRQSTNIHEINETGDTEIIYQPLRMSIQIDCFGSLSVEWATIISTLLRDYIGTEFLEARGITCLFSDEARNMTGTLLGSDQNVSRWMVEAEIERIGNVQISTETMTIAEVTTIEVYSEYPA